LVGAAGFELATTRTPSVCATRKSIAVELAGTGATLKRRYLPSATCISKIEQIVAQCRMDQLICRFNPDA
jgi:hypothetical protein